MTIRFESDNVPGVFNKIKRKTDFSFVYLKSDIDKKARLNASYEDISLYDLLIKLSEEMGLKFKRVNNNINVKKLNKEEQLVIEEVFDDTDVTGTVTDENNIGLPGVSILIKGTDSGTITDTSGNFAVSAPEDGILVFSYIGYRTTEVSLNGRSVIDLAMVLDIEQLQEIVVVGYGTQKRSDLTGAVASMTSKEAKALTVSDPTLALQGRIAGVDVQSNGGAPGSGVSVVIRGAATINGTVSPLYVVDGVFLESLNSLNQNDIESIEVLKDASAAAIYGSRAANGVVIVTTTKGSTGGLVVNAHATVGTSTPTKRIDFLNARQYADVRNAINTADGSPLAPANSTAFDSNIDTDWQDLSLRNSAIQDYGFSVASKGNNSSVYFSANYYKERGVLISSDYDRINMRLNSEYWSNDKKFRLSQTLGLTQKNLTENSFYGSGGGYTFPTLPFKDSDGNFVGPNVTDHGAAFSSNRYALDVLQDDDSQLNEVFGNLSGEVEFLPGLRYKLNLGLSFVSEFDYLFNPQFQIADQHNQNINPDADLTEGRSTTFDGLIDNTLNYNKELGKHSINAVAGYTIQKITTRGTLLQASIFPSNDLRAVSAASEVRDFSGDEIVTGLTSFFGRVIYDYDDKYLFTGTLRRDESSRFAEAFRTGSFPSVSVGWRISNEDFFPSGGIIDDLKLRVSYGELGSQNVVDYAFTPVINLNSNYDFGDSRFFGVSRTQFRLNNLIWETSQTTNFGIDAGFLGGKLQANLDYYIRNTNDILVTLPIPQTAGTGNSVVTNSASIENKGIELSLNYRKSEGEFTYDANLVLTSSNNEVTSLGQLRAPINGGAFGDGLLGTRAIVGDQLGVFWGFETDGLYQSQADIDSDPNLSNSPAVKSQLKPGELIYVDQNGDGMVNNDDKVNIGDPYADLDYGLSFNGRYKNFEFTLFFQGQIGNQILNENKNSLLFDLQSNYSTESLNAWSETNTDSNIPVLGTSRVEVSDFYVENGSYLRLKQIQIAYNVRYMFKGSTQARFFINAQNLLTFSGYSGYDPEIGFSNSQSLLTRGVDSSPYPQSLRIMTGVQFTIK